jgi:two-component system OmpR family response regulator
MKVLIVEDEKRLASFLEKGLREEGMTVDVAPDGEEALALARSREYDAVVLDLMLPRRDGIEVLRILRREGLHTPILILSTRGEVEDRVRGLESGADDYLPKPFAFAELVARLRSIARRVATDPAEASTLRAGDLTVNLLTREVRRDGREIELTTREFELLAFLLRHKERVLTRTLIIEQVWDMQFDTGTNLVDVMVGRLRKKLDDEGDGALIHTVRGAGYALREPRKTDHA